MKHSQMRSSIDVSKNLSQQNVSAFSKSREFYGGGTLESQHMGTANVNQHTQNQKSRYMNDMPMEDTINTVNLQSKKRDHFLRI